MAVYLGVDLGTQGCRTIAARANGSIAGESYASLPPCATGLPEGWSEQDPTSWWPTVRTAIRGALRGLREDIQAVSIDSTSGTILPLTRRGRPLYNAIMYNDGRAVEEARIVSEAGRQLEGKLGYRVRASFSAAKLLWLRRNMERVFESTDLFVHAADFVSGMLTGSWSFTDHTNALKSCFDLLDYEWPDFFDDIGLPRDRMPEVVTPGTVIGEVQPSATADTGIPAGTPVMAGLTDGCASQLASGAAGPGDWETTLGTTMVIKGVTKDLLRDPEGRIYSHLHPEGFWMPGGASTTGGECLRLRFPGGDLPEMDRRALGYLPSGLVSYPLERKGERFPFVSSEARGFLLGEARNDIHLYAACLEGVAYLERMAYELMENLGAGVGSQIFTAGGGSRSVIWLQVRADVLGKVILRPKVPEAAMGVAMLSAASDRGTGLADAAREMTVIDVEIRPREEYGGAYDEGYQTFRSEIEARF
jgi:sugar (pentulose or hexulose) kinase